jgi:stage II sporulation protein D
MRKIFFWGMVTIAFIIVVIPLLTLFLIDFNLSKVEIENMGKTINVFNHQTKQLMEMDLEAYIRGVVAAEMPASFELEALKAQAVAARTYAYKRLMEPDATIKQFHPQAHVVTNAAICQAWTSEKALKEKWGFWDYRKYKKKINEAVEETKGEILVYDNKIIDPVYHASCGGGKTEDSGDVWKYNFPYLKSVQCITHEDKHFNDTKTIPIKNIDVALGTNLQAIPVSKLKGNSNEYIQILETTKTGRIKNIMIGGQKLSGTEVRAKLGLKSTWFTWQINKDSITFITRGYGHGVGMCQYGANAFAREGKTYDQILKHYYQGVKIVKIK